MSDIQIFSNKDFGDVRVIEIEKEPWFVGKDVAIILGYAKPLNALAMHVDEDDSLKQGLIDSMGRTQETIFINESGLYSLILSSKLPKAKEFKRWVTAKVLPSIRKHGAYMTDNTLENVINDPDFGIRLLTKLKEEREARKKLEDKVSRDKPKVLFADAVSTSRTSILIGDLAKILRQNGIEIGQKRLFDSLRMMGYLIKSGSSKNMPTQKSMDLGLFEIKEGSYINTNGDNITTKTTKVTGKGQIYFINKYLGKKRLGETMAKSI